MSTGEQGPGQIPPNVGDLGQWRNRIRFFISLDETFSTERQAIETLLPGLRRDAQAEATILNHVNDRARDLLRSEDKPTISELGAVDASVKDQLSRFSALMDRLPIERLTAFQRNKEALTLSGAALDKRYMSLADQLRTVEPAPYITRAIGRPGHEALAGRWHYVRGKVELGRQLLGVTGLDTTLGQPPTEAWEQKYHRELTANVQRIQIGQIVLAGTMAAADPQTVAGSFGKSVIIEELGPPPPYDPIEVSSLLETSRPDEWYDAAFAMMRKIEPPAGGLLIDRA